jgi:aspartyl-tRNA synthetase
VEACVKAAWQQCDEHEGEVPPQQQQQTLDPVAPFPHMTYAEAMRRFGSDKPYVDFLASQSVRSDWLRFW